MVSNAPAAGDRAHCTLTGSLEQLARLRDFINLTAPGLGCGEQDTFAFELACDEAAANIINHAFDGKTGQIRVELWREADTVSVCIMYHGRVFDPSKVPEPDLAAPLEKRPVGGLGLYFMRQMMNEVNFEFDAEDGNRLTMRRMLTMES